VGTLPAGPGTLFVEDPDRTWAEIGSYLLHDAMTYNSWQTPTSRSHVKAEATTVEALRAEGVYQIRTPSSASSWRTSSVPGGVHPSPAVRRHAGQYRWASLELFVDKVLPHLPGATREVRDDLPGSSTRRSSSTRARGRPLGYESAWLPEHLVFPLELRGQLVPGEEHPPVPPSTPVYDACAYLSWIAAQTTQIRLGTFVYLLGLRHPFVGARAFATLDIVSGGRAEVGVGAGWLVTEWEAAGSIPAPGAAASQTIDVCRRLGREVIEHHGVLRFAPVMFEPKPVQQPPRPSSSVASDRALRRARRRLDRHVPHARLGGRPIATLRRHEQEAGRADRPVQVTVMGQVTERADIERWEAAGVDRLIVVPWTRSREAIDGLRRFADAYFT
jgi:alkanesulfonate monooxygenase SsuD/methylene tetrahydromethanopterin reductase-like flavin-dependent oxidoreductase (luciferase family)